MRVQGIGPAEDELIDQGGHVVLTALGLEDFGVGGVGLPSGQDVTDHLPPEIGGGTKDAYREGGREGEKGGECQEGGREEGREGGRANLPGFVKSTMA